MGKTTSQAGRKVRRVVALGVCGGLTAGLAACGSGGSGGSGNGGVKPKAAAPSSLSCQAVKLGAITRCENFYTDYWPVIKKNMDALYQQAKKTDGGNLVIWDWYAVPKDTIAAFTKQYPGLKIKSRGLNFNLSSSIIAAKASGARSSDLVKGSITSMAPTYDAGMWEQVDWTTYGVPKEFLTIGAKGMLPNSINGSAIQYNSSKVSKPPTSLTELAQPQWKGKVAITDYNAQDFAGYGMSAGKAKMVALIKKLKSSGNLTITNNTDSLLSSGDKPVVLAGQLFSDSPQLKITTPTSNNMYVQFMGVNTDAKNKPGIMLYELWSAFDPGRVKSLLTSKALSTSPQVYPGLPTKTLDEATGLQKTNLAAWIASTKDPSTIFETMDNRKQYLALIDAANKALGG